jgi:ferredoxin-NADP reductase
MEQQTFFATLSKKKEIADHVIELKFSKPEGFEYKAGQFVQFYIPQEEKSVLRSYSISSIPADNYLEFCIKIVEGGVGSTYLAQMNIEDKIELSGSKGHFVLNSNAISHMFVATGAGLAPIMGMIREELESNASKKQLHLLFGVRSEKNIFWNDKLDELTKKYENFSYDICLSRAEDIASCKAVEGRVTANLPKSLSETDFYLCGSAEMVMEVRSLAIERGANAKDIHFEIF